MWIYYFAIWKSFYIIERELFCTFRQVFVACILHGSSRKALVQMSRCRPVTPRRGLSSSRPSVLSATQSRKAATQSKVLHFGVWLVAHPAHAMALHTPRPTRTLPSCGQTSTCLSTCWTQRSTFLVQRWSLPASRRRKSGLIWLPSWLRWLRDRGQSCPGFSFFGSQLLCWFMLILWVIGTGKTCLIKKDMGPQSESWSNAKLKWNRLK